jgi:hypothetical protein
MTDIFGWALATVLVMVTIGIHYEVMRIVSDIVIPWALKRFHDRRAIMLMMVTLMFGHIIEIWVFALVMFLITLNPELGYLSGNADRNLNTFLYFSAVNYTSVGYGDITPHGSIRALAVSEALAGLMMIAWSASLAYLKMEQVWSIRRRAVRKRFF